MTPRLRFAPLALAALVGAGCSLMPAYERPPAPVPAAFPSPSADAGTPAAALDWASFFGDERLRRLVAIALRENRDLRIAVLNIEQARAQFDIRQADRLPTVGAGVAGSRTPNTSGNITSVYTAGITFSAWEIDLFGRLASLGEAARAQFLATQEGRKAVQIALVASVANTWLALAADDELLALTRQTLDSREASLRLIRLRFEHGAASELDLRQAESLAEAARASLAQQQRQRAQNVAALALLLGAPVPDDAVAGVPLASVTLPDVPAGLPADVLVARPDVRQAEQLLVAANANIGAARAALFPRITLTAGIGTASNELSRLFDGGSWGFTLAPQLLQTIFDGGRGRAGVRSAEVAREVAVAQYERAIQTAFREVADALAGRVTLVDQLAAQARAADAEGARLRLATLRYEGGVASFLEVLDAQRSAFAARQALIQVRLARLQNQVLLYRALGGGFAEPPR